MSQQKTGLMYVPASAAYKAGDGYLCIPAEYSPWISTTDYYDTPERVTEAHALLERSGLLAKLVPIAPRPAPRKSLQASIPLPISRSCNASVPVKAVLWANIAGLATAD